MLADYKPIPAIAVKDLERARAFYEDTRGFSPAGDVPEGVIYPAGNSSFLLRAKGRALQTFEVDGLVWDGEVAIIGDRRAVWFADPDGNVLNVESSPV